jgi:hypothetical protein
MTTAPIPYDVRNSSELKQWMARRVVPGLDMQAKHNDYPSRFSFPSHHAEPTPKSQCALDCCLWSQAREALRLRWSNVPRHHALRPSRPGLRNIS